MRVFPCLATLLGTNPRRSRDPLPGRVMQSMIPRGAEQPVHLEQTAHQSAGTDVVADLSGGHEQVQWSALAVTDGMPFGVHAALGPTDQASTPPFLPPILVAVRWALR